MTDTIYLDPLTFDALHLASLAHGGIGGGEPYFNYDEDQPLCLYALAAWVDQAGWAGLSMTDSLASINDDRLEAAGVVPKKERVPFKEWCEIVNVDVR